MIAFATTRKQFSIGRMSAPRWTTIVQVRDGRTWKFFSQQSIKPGERELTDAEYLAACRAEFEHDDLRLAPANLQRLDERFAEVTR